MKLNEIKQTLDSAEQLEKYNDILPKHIVNPDGSIIVLTDFKIDHHDRDTSFRTIPFKNIKRIKGTFSLFGCKLLSSLTNCPPIIDHDFNISSNIKLTSLKGSPTKIGGALDITNCVSIETLEYMCQDIGDDVSFYDLSKLKSLKGILPIIYGDFTINDCSSLKQLDYLPEEVRGRIEISRTPITNLLKLFEIDKVQEFKFFWIENTVGKDVSRQIEPIINKHYKDGQNYAACQEELQDSGLGEFAEY